MIKHIVMWRLHDHADGRSKAENAQRLKNMLEKLPEQIAEIRQLEVGINLDQSDAAADVVLYSEFDSLETLRRYQKHEAHQKVVQFLNKVRSEKRVVDYQIDE